MYPDFMWVAADQVFNQIGKARHMFGGDIDVPFVLRTKVAMGTGYGSQHSMDPAGIFATAPGWRIVAPSTPYDYVGLMNTALASKDPVLVIEHVDLYGSSGEVPAGDLDYAIPFGKAQVRRQGGKVTILTYLSMVSRALKAAEAAGVDAEIIDLRTLDRASLDWDTIGESIKKTNNVLIVEQGARGTSYGAMLADEIQRRWFDWLDQPVKRVTGGEASPSISGAGTRRLRRHRGSHGRPGRRAGRPGRAGMNAPEQARLRMTVPMEVGICCADLDGMLAFYTGVLGLALVNRVSVPADKAAATGLTSAGYDVARLQTSYGERVKLLQPAVAPQPRPAAGAILDRQGATYLTFIVRDLPGVVRQLQARGVTFDSAPAPMEVRPGTWLAFFRDPEGNVLELVEYDDPPPTDPTSSPTRPPPLNRTSTWHTSSSFPPWPPTPRAAICTSGSSRKATRSPSATRWPKSRPRRPSSRSTPNTPACSAASSSPPAPRRCR